jgi:hypothetical protein
MADKKKPLDHLSDEKKAKLRDLVKRFGLDMTDLVIRKGPNMGHWVKNPDGDWKVIKDCFGNLMWPGEEAEGRKAEFKKADPGNAPVVAKCNISVNMVVTIKDHHLKNKFDVYDVFKTSYGRTGYWARLKYHGTEIKHPQPIETAQLVEVDNGKWWLEE